jgi:hypothetical protein
VRIAKDIDETGLIVEFDDSGYDHIKFQEFNEVCESLRSDDASALPNIINSSASSV